MSRAARRREARDTSDGRSRPRRAPLWIMSGSVLAALLVLAVVGRRTETTSHHPTPRADAEAAPVVSAARYASSPRVEQAYAMAAEIPAVLDGMFCYCFCHDNFGHYSLLDCFLSDHAATCGVCMDEAVTAYEMTRQGGSLDQIRAAVDQRYRT